MDAGGADADGAFQANASGLMAVKRAVADVVGYDGSFTHDLSKPVGMKQKLIDDTLLKKFGWQYSSSLQEGIRKTFDYYLSLDGMNV